MKHYRLFAKDSRLIFENNKKTSRANKTFNPPSGPVNLNEANKITSVILLVLDYFFQFP